MSRIRVWPRGALVALAAILVAACQAPPREVEGGWRGLTAADVKAMAKARRLESPNQPPPFTQMEGDFNQDGQRDQVALLVNEAQDRFAPFIFDGAGRPPVQLGSGDARNRMFRYNLSSLGTGHLYAMCLEDASNKRDCESDKDRNGNAIVLLEIDHGGAIFLWDGTTYAERPMRRDTYNLSKARPASEHPLARKPWYAALSPMKPNPDLPTFHEVGGLDEDLTACRGEGPVLNEMDGLQKTDTQGVLRVWEKIARHCSAASQKLRQQAAQNPRAADAADAVDQIGAGLAQITAGYEALELHPQSAGQMVTKGVTAYEAGLKAFDAVNLGGAN